MEMATVNYKLSPGGHSLCLVEADAVETKSVKRRRRDPSAVSIGCNDQKGEQQQQQQQQLQVDQTTTTTTPTVKRSSRFRGVSRHRWTGRFEAHLWDKGSWNPTQRKKGKQVYLGAYDEEESAARAYDLAALKYWGASTFTNFPISDYEKEIEIMKNVTKEEYLASLRRRSSGFSRGVSKYRGVARHHHNGRWEARIGRVFGNKYLYLGTYSTQEEAAHAYDVAAIEYRGINAVTNFDLSTYIRWLRPGANPAISQEPKLTSESLPMASSSNRIPSEETTQLSIFSRNHFPVDKLDIHTPVKQDIFQRKAPISPCNKSSSSPSALGLLLRSSIFKELVEKNLNASDVEAEENEAKNLAQIGNNEVREIFYNQIGLVPYMCPSNGDQMGHIPYVCPSNGDALPGLESKEDSTWPLYSRTRQSIRNGDLNSSYSVY